MSSRPCLVILKLLHLGQQTPSGQRRARTVSKHLASSMSDCMGIMTPVSPIDLNRTSARCKASHPEETVTYQLPGIHLEPREIGKTRNQLSPCPEGSLLPHGGTGSRQRRASCLETPCGSQRAPPHSFVRSFREPQPPEPPAVYSQNAVYSTDSLDLVGRLNQSARKEMYNTPWERKDFCHHQPPAG